MSAFHDNALMGASGQQGYKISRSVRLRSSASAYFNRTPASASNRRTWTWSGWVKRGALGSAQVLFCSDVGTSNSTWLELGFDAGDTLTLQGYTTDSNTTAAVFRDPSAWYHIVVAFDSTQATAANRCKIYINNTQQTLTGAGFTLNADYGINNAQAHGIGYRNWASGVGRYFDGYLTEVNFIDGQALTPSSFGETDTTTGVWKPKKYAGTYGTNGFYLNFSDNSAATATTIGKDYSGNGNNWTPNNISVTAGVTYDSMIDVPTMYADGGNGRGNYAVLNPLWKGSNVTLSGANLDASMSAASDSSFGSTFTITSGKWYWEARITTPSTDYPYIGVATPDFNYQAVGASCIRTSATGFFKASNATKWNSSSSSYGSSFASGDIMMIAYDADSGKIYFGKNGTWDASSDPVTAANPAFTGVNAPVTPAGFVYNCAWSMNFGQRPFSYTPPTGFVALNTQNLPTPTISNGANYMAASLWTGNGTSQTIANSGNNAGSISFQPDFVWLKNRSSITDHRLIDSVRGVSKVLYSSATSAEATEATTITSFNTNGFSVGSGAGNTNTASFVGWQWNTNGGSTVSNTSGSITSTVSAGATQGFSVVTWAGSGAAATVGHGLGVAPKMVIIKNRTTAASWPVYHASIGNTAAVFLNATNASTTSSTYFNNTSPTSSVFSVESATATNGSTNSMVAYCFASVAGYSKFGSYTGNGSADGPFVYCGFRPAFVMVKRTDTTGNWCVFDNKRLGYNGSSASKELYPNLSNAEGTSNGPDQLSNGFKFRDTYTDVNANGGTYIFAAFAENPFKLSLAR